MSEIARQPTLSDAVISVEGLSKAYLVGHDAPRESYSALRDVLVRNARSLARTTGDMLAGRAIVQGDDVEEFWALKDVSFEVKRGEVVGIVGRNGAGKSTLLKILSRITEPTAGRVTLEGRMASLLEVGTGFHPELTGRENVFLNGAILGMGREEIRAKFDEIVAFAELERFIDTPVKRYSSGMYVRLAFAVAAHLEPEILVLDEVLAVGDQQFQQKCLGKIGDVASGGRTVLVVSHNLMVVSSLCDKAVLLEGGRVQAWGEAGTVLDAYARSTHLARVARDDEPHAVDRTLQIMELRCHPEVAASAAAVRIDLRVASGTGARVEELCVLVYAASGERVAILDVRDDGFPVTIEPGGARAWRIAVSSLPLVEGDFSLGLFCKTAESRANHYDLGRFTVTPGATACRVVPYAAQHRGVVELPYEFEVRDEPVNPVSR